MNVDLRRTLAGGDQGKVVDYAVSELRTLEVLESICPGMVRSRQQHKARDANPKEA